MFAPATRRGHLLIAAALLLISILVEQYCIAPFFPVLTDTGSFRPMLVFLDIPLALPAIDLLPVSFLFAVLYAIVIAPVLARGDQRNRLGTTVWKALSGWWILLVAIAAGGGLFYLLLDHLPKQVGNGIDSFGIRADLRLPFYPQGSLHLRGSMFQLLFAAAGLHILAKRTAIAQPVVHATVVREAAVAEHPAAPVFPEDPPTCRLTTPPPILVLVPRPAPGIGKIQPCIVTGSIKPIRATRPDRQILQPAAEPVPQQVPQPIAGPAPQQIPQPTPQLVAQRAQVLYERRNVRCDGVMA